MLDLYILYTGDRGMAELQLALIRRWIPETSQVIMVQGPFLGEYPYNEPHEFPDVKTIQLPAILEFKLAKTARVTNIVNFLFQEVIIRRRNKRSLIMHSDVLPYRHIGVMKTAKTRMAGRGLGSPHPLLQTLTWLMIDNKVVSKDKTVYDYHPFTGYSWTPVEEEQFTRIFPNSEYKKYSYLRMQDCAPGFLHTDDSSHWAANPGLRDKKYELLLENFSCLMNTPST